MQNTCRSLFSDFLAVKINLKQWLLQGSRKKMLYLLIVLICLVVIDGLLTEYLINDGLGKEANPFLESLVGEPGFMLLKVFGSVLCAFILFDVHRRYPRTALITTWIAVVGYFAVVLWNTSLIFLN
jgi:hypothetical protein